MKTVRTGLPIPIRAVLAQQHGFVPPAGPPGGFGYRLISGPDDAEFCRRVSEWISKGYVLYGNPTMVVGDGIVTVGQALVWPTSARS